VHNRTSESKEISMADNDRKSYPRLPAKNWWTLRDRFKQTMPSRVDADYLQSVLGLTSTASAGNLIGPLRNMGLIDEKGAPTDRALDWRHDETYAEVCKAIVTEIYPDALVSAFPQPATDSSGVTNWFARNTGAGQGAASGMAALYSLLADGDPASRPSGSATTNGKAPKATKAAKPVRKPAPADTQGQAPRRNDGDGQQRPSDRPAPSINVNVQVHISAEASPQQIDQIFKSMAEHLYGPTG
jgi:hypothetical protein